jgi:hypothetical protein
MTITELFAEIERDESDLDRIWITLPYAEWMQKERAFLTKLDALETRIDEELSS